MLFGAGQDRYRVATMRSLFFQALLAFLALPGIVAYLVPLLMIDGRADQRVNWVGVAIVATGSSLLLWCVREFYVSGKGTLAPWTPTRHLVISGPYRFSRNPMYVAVALVLCGWAVAFRTRAHAVYAVAVICAFHLRILFGEEPWLERTHGEAWTRYRSHVPRWFGRVHRPPASPRC
jgi:protein-S-isoprenylcysteine O-methyltransferase Ste14